MYAASMRYRIAALTAILAVAFSAPAQARSPYTDALKAAATYWAASPEGARALPCDGEPTLETVVKPVDVPENAIAWTEHPICTIWLNQAYWPSERAEKANFLLFCQSITHELGHLILQPNYFASSDPMNPNHSTDVFNVMYPSETPYNVPVSCDQYAEYWEDIADYTPSVRANVSDEIVAWRTIVVPAGESRVLACTENERLQTKLWIMSGRVAQSRLAYDVLSLTNHGKRPATIRGACEPLYGQE